MATLDALFSGLAAHLIDRLGTTASLETVAKVDDLISGKLSETTVAREIKITPPEPFTIGLIDGTLVEPGDMTTLIAGQGLATAPTANRDRLVFAADTWQIVAIDPIYSGNSVAAYRLQLRN